jgi:hypothetical protein
MLRSSRINLQRTRSSQKYCIKQHNQPQSATSKLRRRPDTCHQEMMRWLLAPHLKCGLLGSVILLFTNRSVQLAGKHEWRCLAGLVECCGCADCEQEKCPLAHCLWQVFISACYCERCQMYVSASSAVECGG